MRSAAGVRMSSIQLRGGTSKGLLAGKPVRMHDVSSSHSASGINAYLTNACLTLYMDMFNMKVGCAVVAVCTLLCLAYPMVGTMVGQLPEILPRVRC